MILKDPINLFLALIPSLIALSLYILGVITILNNTHLVSGFIGQYVADSETSRWISHVITALMVLFVFVLMNWTFVILVGLIAAPFNSMLSSRIEKKLRGIQVESNRSRTMKEISLGIGKVFGNELKKLIAIAFVGGLAFLLNLVPIFYPIGLFLVCILLAVQFVDYSWSRHELSFGACLKDALVNILPYSVSGGLFLMLVTVPLVNAFVPALATSYYTILWVERTQTNPPKAIK
jgi:CysZ protein